MAASRGVLALCFGFGFCVVALLGLALKAPPPVGSREPDLAAKVDACRPIWHATVPLEFHEHDATVPVLLEGHATQFAFDTGASDTYVTHEGQQKLGLRPAAKAAWRVDTVAGPKTVDTFFDVRTLGFAGLEFGPRALPLTDLGYAATSPARAVEMGLMGTDLLKDMEVDLDIPDKRITLYKFDASCRDVRPPFDCVAIPLELRRSGTPLVPLQLNGITVMALFDTGSDRTSLDFDEDDEDDYAKLGTAAEGDPKWLHAIALGGHPLPLFDVAIGTKPLGQPNNTRVGMDVISRHRFWLSLGSRRLFLATAPG